MKGYILALAFFFAAVQAVPTKTLVLPVEEHQVEQLYQKIQDISTEQDAEFEEIFAKDPSAITAAVNDFVDDLFVNIDNFCVSNGLDPIVLEDVSKSILGNSVKLDSGSLKGISSISRNGNVTVTYSHDKKFLTLNAPIKFDAIGFKYHYKITVLLVKLSAGDLSGTINNLRINIELTFDFNSYVAKMKKFNVMNSGHIDIQLDAGLIEQVVTILSELATTILHPLIVSVIQVIVKGVVNTIVSTVNDAINGTFVSPNDVNRTMDYFLNY